MRLAQASLALLALVLALAGLSLLAGKVWVPFSAWGSGGVVLRVGRRLITAGSVTALLQAWSRCPCS